VDVGKSVSRVGGKAQRAAYRAIAGDLKLAYAQFEELEAFSRFGTRLEDETRKIIEHGRRIRACLKQPESAPVSVPAQIIVLLALTERVFDSVPLERMKEAETVLQAAAGNIPKDVLERFENSEVFSSEDREAILRIARQSLARFQSKPEPEIKTEKNPQVEPKDQPKEELVVKPKVEAGATP
jgi:F-type H+-transporting ATPase subunit alpha